MNRDYFQDALHKFTKIQELKDAEQIAIDKKASGKQKLKDLGLTDAEIKALTGA